MPGGTRAPGLIDCTYMARICAQKKYVIRIRNVIIVCRHHHRDVLVVVVVVIVIVIVIVVVMRIIWV